jgi:hypothetical protein
MRTGALSLVPKLLTAFIMSLIWAEIFLGFSLLLAWAKQVSTYVLGFSLTDRSAWRWLWTPKLRFAVCLWAARNVGRSLAFARRHRELWAHAPEDRSSCQDAEEQR